jgi:hypothetical protein
MTNKTALFLLSGLAVAPLLPAHAAAQTPNQKAEAEARSFLTPCAQSEAHLQQWCLRNQQSFVREYVRAKAGDQSNIRGVGSYFRPLAPDADEAAVREKMGEPVSLFQTCVWYTLYSILPLTPEQQRERPALRESLVMNKAAYPVRTCARLTPDEQTAARRRAEQLMQELHSAPAKMPPDDWRPKMAGLVVE